jgi:hypothetical protein
MILDPSGSAYNVEENKLILLVDIPKGCEEKIIKNITRIMRHYSGSSYLYSTISGSLIPREETTYTSKISGFSFGVNRNSFFVGTEYVSIVLLANYKDTLKKQRLIFSNIKLQVIESIEEDNNEIN